MFAKRLVDLLFSFIACCILLLFLPFVALLIKLDSKGPVFYRQLRLGMNGREINVLKLRTMHMNSVAIFNSDGSRYVDQRDPRITRVGHFLRIGFDELPQVYNVLRGEMSFIGPRPDDLFSINNLEGVEWLKLGGKPGITGLAQVTGRNQLPWHDRLKHDVYYIYNRNILLDLKIAWRTLAMLSKIQIDKPLILPTTIEIFLSKPHILTAASAMEKEIKAIRHEQH